MELLAPAGSVESLKAAVNAGADAVYIGGTRFGARAYADNPEEQELLDGIDFCHLHGVKVYMTVNTLVKEQELPDVAGFLAPYDAHGLDGVIVQDLGVLKVLRDAFPHLQLHASTQLTITGAAGAALLKKMGVCRVVPARELSLQEIRRIIYETGLQVETFVHGAMCYSYSGQCLFSSMIGGRSGNRGRCAQPCRLPYELYSRDRLLNGSSPYAMSLKDMCALTALPKLAEAGISSLKIEGRMKKPEYTAGVVSIYRKYLDRISSDPGAELVPDKEDVTALQDLYSRGGFSDGYYFRRKGPVMMSMARPNHLGSKAAVVKTDKGGNKTAAAAETLYPMDVLEVPGQIPGGSSQKSPSSAGKPLEFQVGSSIPAGGSFRLPDKMRHLKNGTTLYRTRCESLLRKIREDIIDRPKKEKIKGELILFSGKHAILNLSFGEIRTSTAGLEPQPAVSRPLTEEAILKQLSKTGDTPFEFEDLRVRMTDGLFLPLQAINALRRDALEQLEKEILAFRYRERCALADSLQADICAPSVLPEGPGTQGSQEAASVLDLPEGLMISVSSAEQLRQAALFAEEGRRICAVIGPVQLWSEEDAQREATSLKAGGCLIFAELPQILRMDTAEKLKKDPALRKVLDSADGLVVRTLDAAGFLLQEGFRKPLFGSSGLYAYNTAAVQVLSDLGISGRLLPDELTAREMKPLTGSRADQGISALTVYGRTALMFTAQCLLDNTAGCAKKAGWLRMRDRKGMDFPVFRDCFSCCNVIYNSVPLNLFPCMQEVQALGPERLHLSFTDETGKEMRQILDAADGIFSGRTAETFPVSGTRGHFRKGVE